MYPNQTKPFSPQAPIHSHSPITTSTHKMRNESQGTKVHCNDARVPPISPPLPPPPTAPRTRHCTRSNRARDVVIDLLRAELATRITSFYTHLRHGLRDLAPCKDHQTTTTTGIKRSKLVKCSTCSHWVAALTEAQVDGKVRELVRYHTHPCSTQPHLNPPTHHPKPPGLHHAAIPVARPNPRPLCHRQGLHASRQSRHPGQR